MIWILVLPLAIIIGAIIILLLFKWMSEKGYTVWAFILFWKALPMVGFTELVNCYYYFAQFLGIKPPQPPIS